MINRDEILQKSREMGVHTANVQRDYVFGWVLAGIYSASDLGNHLVLKGGNCFRKAYFAEARYSSDLDFATTGTLSKDYIGAELNRVCDFVQINAGVQFEKGQTKIEDKRGIDESKHVHEVKLYFSDFFGNASHITLSIRLDISEFEKILLPVQTRTLIHAYSDQDICRVQIRCLKLEEMLAGKLKCLLQRRHSGDLYDFVHAVFVSPHIELSQTEIASTFLKMTIFSTGPRIVKDLLSTLPFPLIQSLWEKFLMVPRMSRLDFAFTVDTFLNIVDTIFGSLPVGHGTIAFFPAHLRTPIIEAGYRYTLLRIVYDGVSREVEPYSLKYKTRRDGLSREYLYVFDCSGGRRSGPGIKSLVHEKIQSIENTNIEFTPRYEVELSKAGQYFQERYFRGAPRRQGILRVSSLRRSRRTSSKRYIFECALCHKRFYRDKYNTTLNPHTDRDGFRCYGRYGYLV